MAALLCVGGGGFELGVEYRRHCGFAYPSCERRLVRGTDTLSVVAHLGALLTNMTTDPKRV
jgi:hypothetical protein